MEYPYYVLGAKLQKLDTFEERDTRYSIYDINEYRGPNKQLHNKGHRLAGVFTGNYFTHQIIYADIQYKVVGKVIKHESNQTL